MKKLLFLGALALSSLFASAQDFQGKWFAGGQLSYSDQDEVKTTVIAPMAGTFITSDLAVGASLGYVKEKMGDVSADAFFVQPLVRKYWNITGPLNFFGQVSLPLYFGDDYNSYGLDVAPGLDLVINNRFSIETSFSIFSFAYDDPDGGDSGWGLGAYPTQLTGEGRSLGGLKVGFKFFF